MNGERIGIELILSVIAWFGALAFLWWLTRIVRSPE
jgi:hypothetical protein